MDYLPEVNKRLGSSADRLEKENLILELVPLEKLDLALWRWERERSQQVRVPPPRWSPNDLLLDRVMAACRQKEKRHPGLRIEPVACSDATSPLRLATVSYEEEKLEVRYGLGVTSQPLDLELLERFMELLNQHYLDTAGSGRPRLIYHLARRAPPPVPAVVREARRFKPPLIVLSLDEYEQFVDIRPAVERQTHRLNTDARYHPALYVPQRMDIALGTGLRFRSHEEPALKTVLDWLHEQGGRFVLLLGDFGTGKTFLLYEVARRLGLPDSTLLPLVCELRHIEKKQELDSLLVQHMQQERIEPIDPQALRHMCRLGKVVLLFDGFDELALRTDYARAAQHLETLISAVEDDAKVLVTSRTQHFLTDSQVATVLAQRLERVPTMVGRVRPFEREQIRQFLSNQLGGDEERAQARFHLLDSIKDLLGLSTNPRMLSLIAQLDTERLRAHGQIGAAQLYQALVSQWIEAEMRRKTEGVTGPMLTRDQLMQALHCLALLLWRKTEPTASLEELEQAAASLLKHLELELGIATQQIGSSSLLCRDSSGRFSFFHHSLLEWLIARQMADEIQRGACALMAERVITPLMAEFLRGFLGDERATAWVRGILEVDDADEPGSIVQSALVLVARLGIKLSRQLSLAGQDLRGRDLSRLDLRKADLSKADLREVSLVGKNLRLADLRGARLTAADLRKADLRGADLRDADLERANLLGADLRGARLKGAVLRRAKLVAARLDPGALVGADAARSALDPRPEPKVLPLPTGEGLTFNPAGDLIAAAADSVVALYDAYSGECLRTLTGHESRVMSIAFHPNGRTLASGSRDQTIRIWDVDSGRCLQVLEGHRGNVSSVAFSATGTTLASGSWDQTICLWDVGSGACVRTLTGHLGDVSSVAFGPEERRLASGSRDRTVRLWDANTGECLRTLTEHEGWVSSIAFSPDGEMLASGAWDQTVRLWNASSGACVRTLTEERAEVSSVVFGPDGSLLASGFNNQLVRIWDVGSGRCLQTLAGHRGEIRCVAFAPGGRIVATGSRDRSVRLWDVKSAECLRVLAGHRDWVTSMAVSPDGKTLAAGSRDRAVRLWDVAGGKCRWLLLGHMADVSCVALGTDGKLLASGSADRTVRLWDTSSGTCLKTMLGHLAEVVGVAFSPDGKTLVSGSRDQTVRLWDVSSGSCLQTRAEHQAAIASIAFSPNGKLLASGSWDQTIRIWDTGSGTCSRIGGSLGEVTGVAFAPDGRILASSSGDKTIRLWEVSSSRCLRIFRGHHARVTSIAFSPDGQTIASGASDRSVRIWDVSSGKCLRVLNEHLCDLTSVVFSSQGRILLSASEDQTVRLWDVLTGRCLAVLVTYGEGWAAFEPDTGRYRYVGELGGMFWLATGLCRFAPGELDEFLPDIRLPEDHSFLPSK